MDSLFLWCILAFSASVIYILQSRYRQLSHINGPFLANFTDLWRAQIQFFGPFVPTLIKLHEKYGKIVRIGPNTVSISDPSYINIIASPRGGFAKADSYSPLRIFLNGRSIGSIIDMQDEDRNRSIKRTVGPFFTTKHLLKYEPDLSATLSALADNLRTHHLNGHPFSLYPVMQYFQLDFLFRIAFSASPGHLAQNRDVHGMASSLYKRIFHWYSWQPLSRLERFLFQNPLWTPFLPTRPAPWAIYSAQAVQARLSSSPPSSTNTSLKPTDLSTNVDANHDYQRQDLLQKYLSASLANPHAIPPSSLTNLVNSTISAGADTTSGALTTLLYLILRHRRVRTKLQNELATSRVPLPVRYASVEKLPYLDATIREALRYSAPLSVPLERTVPSSGCFLGEHWLPGGAVVGCAAYVVHRDRAVFGEDAEEFRPERYLGLHREVEVEAEAEAEAEVIPKVHAMERANLAWGLGHRVCLGRHVAELEMKMAVATLLLQFDFELCDPELDIPFVELGTFEMQSKPVMVTVRERSEGRMQ